MPDLTTRAADRGLGARRRRLLLTPVVLIGGVLLLAACGGGGSHAGAATNSTSTTPDGRGPGGGFRSALTAFRDCMASQGVTLPQRTPRSTVPGETRPSFTPGSGFPGGGGFGGGGFGARFATRPAGLNVSDSKYAAAYNACKSKLPSFNGNGGGFLNNSAFQAYFSCLKDHGVTIDANNFRSINRSDPKVQAAMTTCRPLLPQGGFGRGGSSSTTAPSA